ncbi:MAG TPA: hypothetical protein DD400_02865 [Rhodospirillaceae bacterium]|nr:hypothetical protein [Rhodospirillaceae bacterium]
MRWFLTAFTVVFIFVSGSVQAAELIAQSQIASVTVFADRAMVTRSATIDVPKDASTIVFEGLPRTLLTNSLRVEGKSQAKIILGALENKRVSSSELAVPREREINARLEALKDQKVLVLADQSALEQKKKFLETLAQQASARAREDIAVVDLKPEQWAKSAAALETLTQGTLRALAEKGIKLRGFDRQILALKKELDQLKTGARSSITVRVPVESNQESRLSLQITYLLPQAGWSPVYDARLNTKSGQVRLVQYGEVRQRTGEDWNGVKLTLSTAQPARGAALPSLHSMWINFRGRERLRKGMIGNAMELEDSMSGGGVAPIAFVSPKQAGAPPQEAKFIAANLKAGEYVAEYEIAGENNVPSDGSTRKVMVGSLEVKSELVVKIKPQLDAVSAYLVAVTKLSGKTPLLPGMASLFRDGAFIGSTHLPLLRTGEETDLGFGIDDKVLIKRHVVKDEMSEAGVLVKDKKRLRQTLLEVKNLHRKPVKIEVLQTVPVPRNKKIVFVLDEKYTTSGFEKDADNVTGQMRWKDMLKPQQKLGVKLGWSLSWPKDNMIGGLLF